MKVSHINFSDLSGGASIAANRICKALKTHSFETELRVQKKYSSLDYVHILNSRNHDFYTSIIRKLEFLLSKFLFISKETFSISMHFSNAYKKINDLSSNLIHLHWINGGMLSIKDISKIQKPLVWTLHDMWAFSGPRHYYLDPELSAISGIHTKVTFFEKSIAKAIYKLAKEIGVNPLILDSVIMVNNLQPKVIIDHLEQITGDLNSKNILVLGLAFKPETDDVRESVSIKIIQQLINKKCKVSAHDPIAINNAKKVISLNINFVNDWEKEFYKNDIIIISTNWNEYKRLKQFDHENSNQTIYDTRSLFNKNDFTNINYININYNE